MSHNEILLSHKREWSAIEVHTTACMNFRHYAKWKKSDAKDHMLYDSTDMKYPKKQIYKDRK